MNIEAAPLCVWLDVGGTFTDCLVTDSAGNLRIGKVLSSGSTFGTVEQGSTPQQIVDSRRSTDAEQFWKGFQLHLLDESGARIDSRKVVHSSPSNATLLLDQPFTCPVHQGQSYELTSHLLAPALAVRKLLQIPLSLPLPPLQVRMGTTRGTNALLTRRGARTALLTTEGFTDCLAIGDQDRPDLFALNIHKRIPLAETVVGIRERLTSQGAELIPLDEHTAFDQLQNLKERGIESIAICLLHAWRNEVHEQRLMALARKAGFQEISCSSKLAPLIRLVARAETTVLDAYLNPVLSAYVQEVWQQLGGEADCQLQMMTSGGVLVAGDEMHGMESVLSGPAGGCVALAEVAKSHGFHEAIGLDMGGTSTDVSRIDRGPVRQYESIKAGVRILTPSMAIHTVAAGGGSICGFDGQRLFVGPDSAGANPGPACYRRGGPLTVSDLNLLLGRLLEDRFPFRLDRAASQARLNEVISSMEQAGMKPESPEQLAEGLWQIANQAMAEAVRSISVAEGVDPRPMVLVGFGGAAGQHICAIAEILGMREIIDHPHAGVMSALGMGLAPLGRSAGKGIYQPLHDLNTLQLQQHILQLAEGPTEQLLKERGHRGDRLHEDVKTTALLELRYRGNDSTLEVPWREQSIEEVTATFVETHQHRFGFIRSSVPIELVSLRVDCTLASTYQVPSVIETSVQPASPIDQRVIWCRGSWIKANEYHREDLRTGDTLVGPAIVTSSLNTLLIDSGWEARVTSDGAIRMRIGNSNPVRHELQSRDLSARIHCDPVMLEIFARRFQAIADQMGNLLQRTAMSVNIKERRDFSCAIFRSDGSLVANAPHVPVHLGAMGHTVRHLIHQFPHMVEGDCLISNDPYTGGSHLPDVTMVQGVFIGSDLKPRFFVANRAHHAEIGGVTPGSMPPNAHRLFEEGVLIKDFALIQNGVSHHERLRALLTESRYPSRTPDENLADLAAQQAANRQGVDALKRLCQQYAGAEVDAYMGFLQDTAERAIMARLKRLPDRPLHFIDHLDDGTPLAVTIARRERDSKMQLVVDFKGSGGVHPGNFNASPGIVTAAVMYVLRCLMNEPLPLNDGVIRCVDLRIPEGILRPPADVKYEDLAAVVAGNVETSQRLVDVLFGAFGVCAASQGTMNNFLMGDRTFGYYETIGGGSGATANHDGASAVHTHMTNTRITDPEVLEQRYPVRLWQFSIRRGSGGKGQASGGDGLIREIEFLKPLEVSLITSRRGPYPPYGVQGGAPGQCGVNSRQRTSGTWETLPGRTHYHAEAGERLRIETPGGGGFNAPHTPPVSL